MSGLVRAFDEWALKNGDRMRVSVNYFAGYDFVHIRLWQRGPNGRLYPTQKGAAIGIHRFHGCLFHGIGRLVINLKTAKALGLDVPATLLARADEVIE